jgi:uncharacterized Zn finger protein
MSFYSWGSKPTVAEQRKSAEKKLAQLRKGGKVLSPVTIEGTKIASSFWGKSWCANLERYSDYASRLPRGRSYVRHGSVIDLQIAKGEIKAQVNGSSLYQIRISIVPVVQKHWNAICTECASSIDTMVELLQGRLAKTVMDRVCRRDDGLFPTPKQIKLSCSCPDGARMCKHVAAALYGVGARLDARPELLFVLRGVDQQELIAQASSAPTAAARRPAKSGKVLAETDLASVFGLDMAARDREEVQPAKPGKRPAPPKTIKPRQEARAVTKTSNALGTKSEATKAKATKAKARPVKRRSTAKSLQSSSRRKNHTAISIT